jgi:Heavy-metal resistance
MSTRIPSATTNISCTRSFLFRITILGHHHVTLRRPGFHHGFFFGQRAISVLPSSVVISSHPGVVRGFTVLPPERIINEDSLLERPLISIMLRHRHDLGLSPQQVQDLEQLRDGYQREAIRYEANLRIAEMALQRLLKADPVKLEQVRAKLQDIERLKVELRLARIQAIEQGKALLSPEQYEKLQSLLGESPHSKFGDERFSPLPEDKP